MWRRVRPGLRRGRAAYHRLVPRQLPNGVIPWRTPILTLAVWTPPLAVFALVTGESQREIAKSAVLVVFVASLVWVGKVRHWASAFFACQGVAVLTGIAFYSLPVWPAVAFAQFLSGAVAGLYTFAAMSRWNAPRLRTEVHGPVVDAGFHNGMSAPGPTRASGSRSPGR
jgi:hypothetical protein